MDCYNQDYTPEQYKNDTNIAGLEYKGISFHVNRWSNACMSVTPNFAEYACKAFQDYDNGFYEGIPSKTVPRIVADWVSDEMIIREHLQDRYVSVPRCDFAFIKPRWEQAPLVNISRSIISRAMASIPVVRWNKNFSPEACAHGAFQVFKSSMVNWWVMVYAKSTSGVYCHKRGWKSSLHLHLPR